MNDLFSMEGRVAIITGGSEKLGASMAEALGRAGATVVITSRSLEKARKGAEAITSRSASKIIPRALDLTREEAIEAFFAGIHREYGRIDVLINNASGRGIQSGSAEYANGQPELQPLRDWEYTLYHNVTNAFLCCKHALPFMKESRRGSIINISSIAALVGRDRWVYGQSPAMIPNTSDYNAAKAAMIGFTKDLAAQVGTHGIRVNAIAPGGFQHPSQPREFIERYASRTMLGRMGCIESDLQGAALFLASDASAYVTAHTLVVDGGFTQFC